MLLLMANLALEPTLRPYFEEALIVTLRWKEGLDLQPTVVGVSSSNAKSAAMPLLHSSGLPYVPLCIKESLLLVAILGSSQL